MASVKKNFAYSSILTVSSYIFPLLTYPYVSRVLGVSNIGICNYVDSIIHYFVMFSSLGISVTGIREIAAVGQDKQKCNSVFSSLVILHTITTFIAVISLLVCIQLIPAFHVYERMMYIGVLKLIFNLLLIEWFYKGTENFKYITNRAILVKFFYVVLVFLFVRNSNDYDVYYLLTISTIVINAIINIFHVRKYVTFIFHNLNFRPFISGFIIFGIYNLVSSLYTSFNVAYLGFVTDTTQVGYYSTAQKLYMIIIALYSAFTGVMLPRMSSLLNEGKMDEFKVYINKSIGVLLSFSLPLIVYTSVFSPHIIRVLSGPGYEGAITPMRIVMPLILIIGYEQILVIQTMMPLKKDKIVFRNSLFGAIVGLILNFSIVGNYGAVGSAIVWLCCEFVVLFFSQLYISMNINMNPPYKKIVLNIISYIPAIAICFFVTKSIDSTIMNLVVGGGFMLVYFLFIQKTFLQDEVVVGVLHSVQSKIRSNKHL